MGTVAKMQGAVNTTFECLTQGVPDPHAAKHSPEWVIGKVDQGRQSKDDQQQHAFVVH